MEAMATILVSIGTIFSYFLIYKSPQCFLPSFKSNGFLVPERSETDFQYGGHGGHLGFPNGTILAYLINKSPRCFPSSFKSVTCSFSVQETK